MHNDNGKASLKSEPSQHYQYLVLLKSKAVKKAKSKEESGNSVS